MYRAGDAPHGGLAGESVAVLGYGHLGRTAALNLRDSGAKVRIGNREDAYAEQARVEGFEVVPLSEQPGRLRDVLTRPSTLEPGGTHDGAGAGPADASPGLGSIFASPLAKAAMAGITAVLVRKMLAPR